MLDILEDPVKPPESTQILKRFLETQDLSLIEKPISFAKNESAYANYLFCRSLFISVPRGFVPCVFCPIGMWFTSRLIPYVDMQLDTHAVRVNEGCNDFFCHIRTQKKSVPLDKIQDVMVEQGCLQTCFGLKILYILTGGVGNESAAFLENPDEVRAAIMLAVRLSKARDAGGITKGPSMTNSLGGVDLTQRLAALDKLVQRGVLTQDEASTYRVQILGAQMDLTQVLLEAADLRDSQRITSAEFGSLRKLLLSRLI